MGWLWHQLDHMQIICISLHTDNHASTSPLSFYSVRNARIASAVLAIAIPSVRPSVCLSVRQTPVLCQNDGM